VLDEKLLQKGFELVFAFLIFLLHNIVGHLNELIYLILVKFHLGNILLSTEEFFFLKSSELGGLELRHPSILGTISEALFVFVPGLIRGCLGALTVHIFNVDINSLVISWNAFVGPLPNSVYIVSFVPFPTIHEVYLTGIRVFG